MKALVDVKAKKAFADVQAQGTVTLLRELGITVDGVETAALYALEGEFTKADVAKVAKDLLADPVTQDCEVHLDGAAETPAKGAITLDVWLKPNVTDPVAPSVERGARDLGVALKARVGQRYVLKGTLDAQAAVKAAWRALANPIMHTVDARAG
jgi:phosphoribosylformylglycinamidine (FGAM) synthase PurS component